MITKFDLQAGQKFLSIPAILCKKIGNKETRFFRLINGNTEEYHLECDGKILHTFNKWQFYLLNSLFLSGGDRYQTLLENVNERFTSKLTRSDIDRLFEDIKQKQLFDRNEAEGHPLTKPLFAGIISDSQPIKIGAIKDVFTKENFLKAGLYARKGLINIKAAANQDNKKAIAKAISGKITAIKSLDKETIIHESKRTFSFARWLLKIVFSGIPDNDPNNQEAEQLSNEIEEPKKEDARRKRWYICNPTNFLKKNIHILSLGKYLLYPLPFCALVAILTVIQNSSMAGNNIDSLSGNYTILINDFIFGCIIISTMDVLTTISVAYAYGATIKDVSFHFFGNFLPRFIATIEDNEKFTRRQTLWFYAAPALMRLWLFTIGIFIWDHSRTLNGFMRDFGITLAWISSISIMFNTCPFLRSDGHNFMCAFLNEPELRKKAFKALLSKWRKGFYIKEDSNVLAIYAMVCGVFVLGSFIIVIYIASHLIGLTFGPAGILLTCTIITYFSYKVALRLYGANEIYLKQQKFERWRERILPEEVKANLEREEKPVNPKVAFIRKFAVITAIIAMPFPYPYTPSGQVVLLPITQQQITSDVGGIIDEVYYDGGEYLEKGALIAKIAVNDSEAQLAIRKGKLEQQEAYIKQLKAKPSKEDIALAEQALQVANTRWLYSNEKCARQKMLYKSGAISLESMSAVEQVCEVDRQQLNQAQAELDKVKSGIPAEEIATAEAALDIIKAEIKMYEDEIARSEFRMPFSGKLSTLFLKQKQGQYLERGVPLAMAQDESEFKASIEIPQTDAPYVKIGNRVRLKTMAYPEKTFEGTVKAISADVESKTYGEVLKMDITLKSDGNMLKSGMTGYAKVTGDSISIWKMMTQTIYRFVTVELWAWLP